MTKQKKQKKDSEQINIDFEEIIKKMEINVGYDGVDQLKDDGNQTIFEDELIKKLGINIEREDAAYFMYMILFAINNPDEAKVKIKLFSHLLDKMIPDVELTRIRTARFLFAIENLCFAIRNILEIEDFNILKEIKIIAKEYLNQFEKDADKANIMIGNKFEKLIRKINNNESANVKV